MTTWSDLIGTRIVEIPREGGTVERFVIEKISDDQRRGRFTRPEKHRTIKMFDSRPVVVGGLTWDVKRQFIGSFCPEYFNPFAQTSLSLAIKNPVTNATFVGYISSMDDGIEYWEPAAICVVRAPPENQGRYAVELTDFCVHPQLRGRGYGSHMLRYYEDLALLQNPNYQFIHIEALNIVDTLEMYKRRGYEFVTSKDRDTPHFTLDLADSYRSKGSEYAQWAKSNKDLLARLGLFSAPAVVYMLKMNPRFSAAPAKRTFDEMSSARTIRSLTEANHDVWMARALAQLGLEKSVGDS